MYGCTYININLGNVATCKMMTGRIKTYKRSNKQFSIATNADRCKCQHKAFNGNLKSQDQCFPSDMAVTPTVSKDEMHMNSPQND